LSLPVTTRQQLRYPGPLMVHQLRRAPVSFGQAGGPSATAASVVSSKNVIVS